MIYKIPALNHKFFLQINKKSSTINCGALKSNSAMLKN